MSNTATLTVYNASEPFDVTGKIKREYPKGLTIETDNGLVFYATFDRVKRDIERKALLW